MDSVVDSKDSKYAYVHFIDGINQEDVTVNGELVQFYFPFYKGETNLVTVDRFNFFQENFPDRIKGDVIKQDNLLNVIKILYDGLKKDISSLPEEDKYVQSQLCVVESYASGGEFYVRDEESVNDLASKLICLQIEVRRAQRNAVTQNYHK